MWLIQTDGDVFQHKRLWLRPGKRFIFGRTSAEAGGFVIANKTISRKHLLVEVSGIAQESNDHQPMRSKITLEDLNTKIGTLVNGVQIRGQRHVLDGDAHEIKLGYYEEVFRITWFPVALTFSFTGKELKKNPLESLRTLLEGLDVSVLLEYMRGFSTHVVAKKRNTSKGLQALINGTFIVDYTFVDAIIAAAEAKEGANSLLETDFDGNWPDELQHLPPRGKESAQQPSEAYLPDLRRQTIFDGYTFVFYEESQFDNLLAPITNGRGKALLSQVQPTITEIEDFVRYVKIVAGEKGLGEFEDGSEGKGVVVVRYQPAKSHTSDWYSEFGRQVSLRLDHRLIEQSEFLDAILENDACLLRKPLDIEPSGIAPRVETLPTETPVPSEPSPHETHEKPSSNADTGANASRRVGRSRRAVTRRFKGFDDDITNPLRPAGEVHPTLFTSQEHDIEYALLERSNPSNDGEASNSPPSREEPGIQDMLEQLAPAASKLKRHFNDNPGARPIATTTVTAIANSDSVDVRPPSKRAKRQIDILETARQVREKEEAINKAERETLQEAFQGLEVEKLRNLAVIEVMEVNRPVAPDFVVGSRWDERWNGRKNFKKFRRKGESRLRAVDKVIVPLLEVKKKDFGIGDGYWLNGDGSNQRQKKSSRPRNPENESQVDQSTIIRDVQSQGKASDDGIRPPNVLDSSGSILGRKRGLPAGSIAAPVPVKKSRSKVQSRQESDESDDDLGFRFSKRS